MVVREVDGVRIAQRLIAGIPWQEEGSPSGTAEDFIRPLRDFLVFSVFPALKRWAIFFSSLRDEAGGHHKLQGRLENRNQFRQARDGVIARVVPLRRFAIG